MRQRDFYVIFFGEVIFNSELILYFMGTFSPNVVHLIKIGNSIRNIEIP